MTEATHADYEEEWCRRAADTCPADRAAAEAAARRFYDCVGFLGTMQTVLWANSFPEFARMVRCMDRGLGWHVLYSFLKTTKFVDPDNWLARTCSLPAGFLRIFRRKSGLVSSPRPELKMSHEVRVPAQFWRWTTPNSGTSSSRPTGRRI